MIDVRARYAVEVPDNAYNTLALDLGDFGYQHPDLGYYTRDEAYMKQSCIREGKDPDLVYHFDTRPTIKSVLESIREKEEDVWDEYISWAQRYEKDKSLDDKFPSFRWLACYVVTGSNEGLYLHVDMIDGSGRREMLFVGKSLGHTWEQCWLSAARIAAMLNA